jgi:hypothetical protein
MRCLAWPGVVVSLLLAACRFNVDWRSHASYRSMGEGIRLAHVEPDEALRGVISADLHYVTVAIDSVFFRNLPGLQGGDVVMGLEVLGRPPAGKAIQTVVGLRSAIGAHGFLSFENVAFIEPFLYRGGSLTLRLHFRAVDSPAELANLRGRLSGVADVVRKIEPGRYQALETGLDLFRSVIRGHVARERSWAYEVTLHPADSIYRDKPEMLLTATRHILLFRPPPGAPAGLRELATDRLISHLRLRGSRLVWRHNDEDYTETPYIILNITRYRRYEKPTAVRKIASAVDNSIDQGNLDHARALLLDLAAAITQDPHLSTSEKHLERAWKDVREVQIALARARKDNDASEELRQTERQVRLLQHIRKEFAAILQPADIKDIEYRVSQLALRAEIRGKESNLPADPILALAKAELPASATEAARQGAGEARFSAADLAKLPPPPALPEWKHLYEKWWFWTLVSVGAAGAGLAGYALGRSAPTRTEVAPPPGPGVSVPFPLFARPR